MADLFETLRDALADRYAVQRELGRGGMATVFLAEDLKHHRPVAIKVLHPELAAALGADRFLREIEIAARLQHPHILPLYDSGAAGSFLYYVMPYVEGESLRDRLDREKQLALEEALRIATEVAGALSYAHVHGVVHRDIKPENIMLSGGTAVVADFGIARAVSVAGDNKLTQTGTVIGTPAYMSPEQATGSAEVDGRSDQYSLACVVYEMLVGEPPFTGPTAQAVIARHSLDTVSPPSIVRATIPEPVEDAILRALTKVPADRFVTAAQFAEALTIPGAVTGVRRRTTRAAAVPRWWPRLSRPVVLGLGAMVIVAGVWAARSLWRGGRRSGLPGGGLDPRHIAVLYFEDLSKGKDLRYLADGLTEGLIDQLGQVQALQVISKGGVAPYRTADIPRDSIARVLKVGSLIEGSVEDVGGGNRVRVTVRLIDGASGADIQRASLELPSGELLAVRDSLAGEVSRLLRSWLGQEILVRGRRAGTSSVEAWALVQRGEKRRKDAEALLRHNDAAGSFQAFQQVDSLLAAAETADPQWVDPIVLRGQVAYRRSRLASDPKEAVKWIDLGMGHVERALRLAPKYPAALELRGTLQYFRWLLNVTPDPTEHGRLLHAAQQDLEAAVEVDPKLASAYSTLSHLYYKTKDVAAAVIAARQAYEADAYLSVADDVLARLFYGAYDLEQHAQAKHWCEEGHRRFPEDFRFVECQLWLMTTSAQQPNVADAWRLLGDVQRLTPAPRREFERHRAEMVVGGVIARAGLKDSARHVLVQARASREVDPQQEVECIEAFMRTLVGDRDEAIDLLKGCVAASHVFQQGGNVHWWWRNLQSDPRFREVVGTKQ